METYADLMEKAWEGFFRVAPDGSFLRANATLLRLLGYPSLEELQAGVRNALTRCVQDRSDAREILARLRRDGLVEGFETVCLRRDGSGFWAKATIMAVPDGQGGVGHYEGCLADVSDAREKERFQREAALAEARNKATLRSLALIRRMVRGQLGFLLSSARKTLDPRLEDRRHESLRSVAAHAQSISRCVGNALEYLSCELGGVRPSEAPFQVRHLIREAAGDFDRTARGKGVALDTDIAQDLPEQARGDEAMLRRVLDGLLRRAMEAARSGRVVLRAWREEGGDPDEEFRLLVSVSGSGGTIQRAELAGMEEASAGQDGEWSGQDQGCGGLDLALCRRLAAILDGGVRLEGGEGRGFTLTLSAPLGLCPAEEIHTAAGRSDPALNGVRKPGPAEPMSPEDRGRRMRELFVATVAKATDKLGEAIALRDAEGVAAQAHSLVNSAVVCGAEELAGLAKKLELDAKSGNFEDMNGTYEELARFDPAKFEVDWRKRFG